MAGIGDWVIGVFLKWNGDGTIRGMQRLATASTAASDALRRSQGWMSRNQYALNQYARRMEEIAARRQAIIGNISTGVAVAGIAAMGDAIDQASKLQQTLLSIRSETGANTTQMERFRDVVYSIGDRSGVGPTEAATLMLDVSRLTAGQLSIAQMQAIAPHIADVASMIHFNRPEVSMKDAADSIIQLVHLNRAYTPAAMNPLANKLYRLMGLMVETPQAAVRQMTYYEPLFKGVGVDSSTEIAVMALLDRAGFRNKVGTGVAASLIEALGPLQLTKHFQEGQEKYLTQMGIFRGGKFAMYDRAGNVDYIGMMRAIYNFAMAEEKRGVKSGEVERILYGVFGRQGGRIASLFADPTISSPVGGAFADIVKYLKDPNVSLQAGMANRDRSVIFQAQRAWGNFQALMTELAWPWLTQLAGFLQNIGDRLHALQGYFHAHRDVEKGVGVMVAAITAIAGGLAGLASLGVIARIGGMIATASSGSSVFMGAAGWIDSFLFKGMLSQVALGLMDLFGANGIGPLIARFIPGVGWGLAAVTAMKLLVTAIENAPSIITAIHNWWEEWKGPIAYTIGYAFGLVAKMMNDAIMGLANAVGSSVMAMSQNWYLLATPGGNVQLMEKMAESFVAAQNQWDSSHHTSAWSELNRGLEGGTLGHSFQPHFDVNISVQDGKVTSVQVQQQTSRGSSSGNYPTSPLGTLEFFLPHTQHS